MQKILLCFCVLLLAKVNAQTNSLLYQISGNGLRDTSYLFGTMHTADARVLDKATRALPHFNRCKTYAMELDPNETLDMSLITQLMMGKGYSIKNMLPEKEYLLLDSLMYDQIGMPALLFDNVAPIVLMSIVEAASLGLSDSGSTATEPLDFYLGKLAEKNKQKVVGIETVEEQLLALNSLTYTEQADLLLREINSIQKSETQGDEVLALYLSENLDELLRLNNADPMPTKFYDALITQRNKRMADRVGALMKNGSVFVAIGALHLPGTDGVLALLKKMGYTISPLIANK